MAMDEPEEHDTGLHHASEEACPLAAVDKRLEDAHATWHQAEAAYFDPEGFRRSIQATIQILRTVTFVLQNHKHLIPNFEEWYTKWQDDLRNDPLMRWMVNARNKIEKQGDLEANSFVHAEVVASYLEGPAIQVPANLTDPITRLIESLPTDDLGKHILDNGTLRIQRKWVENSLPDYELLDAVALAFGRISDLVADAHRQLGIQPPTTANVRTGEVFASGRRGRLPCMIAHAEPRTMNISLSEGDVLSLRSFRRDFDPTKKDDVVAHYGFDPSTAPQPIRQEGQSDEEYAARTMFGMGRVMIEKDGYHVTTVFLIGGDRRPLLMQMDPHSQRDKYLLMRHVANEVERHAATAVIMIGEAWTAKFDPSRPFARAQDSKDRGEILSAMLVRKDGNALHLAAEIRRDSDGNVRLGETTEVIMEELSMFAPVYDVWKKAR